MLTLSKPMSFYHRISIFVITDIKGLVGFEYPSFLNIEFSITSGDRLNDYGIENVPLVHF